MNEDTLHFLGHRQRLRDRFLKPGGEHIADYELLELILFSARPRGDVKPLAKRLLRHFGSFDAVIHADSTELKKVDEVGDATIAALKVVLVASQRLVKAEVKDKPVIQSWNALMDYCKLAMAKNKIEEFRVLFLNNSNALIADEVLQRGTVNHTPVYPREIIKRALELSASSLILLHNHPSGDPTPSTPDIDMTEKIVDAARSVGITIHDHVIISETGTFSFSGNGLL